MPDNFVLKKLRVRRKIPVEKPQFFRTTARQKMAYADRLLRGSSGMNAVLILKGN